MACIQASHRDMIGMWMRSNSLCVGLILFFSVGCKHQGNILNKPLDDGLKNIFYCVMRRLCFV